MYGADYMAYWKPRKHSAGTGNAIWGLGGHEDSIIGRLNLRIYRIRATGIKGGS
jgi:hypothetical protein